MLSFHNSKECQVQHWKQHKSTCTLIKEMYDMWKEDMSKVLPDGSALDTKEGPCAICLEETITNPVVLPCGHAFCFACMGSYQSSSDSEECPYCRGAIPNVGVKAVERATLYIERTISSSKGSDEQKKYAKLALAELDAIFELLNPEDEQTHVRMLFWRLTSLSMADQPEEAIQVAKEFLLLNEKHPGISSFDNILQAKHYQAQAYSDCGKWKDAVKRYNSLIREQKQLVGNPGLAILMDYCRAMYELSKYDEAVEYGKLAIELNRSLPVVHKYVALSHKAMGDIDAAAKTMSRAILYETHWDTDNLQKNKQLLRELNNL